MVRKAWIVIVLAVAASAYTPDDANAQFSRFFSRQAPVAEISVNQLRELRLDQAAEQSPAYVLVDVRSTEETAVSVIPGAITKEQFEKGSARYRGRTVIAYCTSGYRSGKYAGQLAGKGIKAKNFKGSILAWCRAGLPLVTTDGTATNRVHTYSSRNRVPAKYKAVW